MKKILILLLLFIICGCKEQQPTKLYYIEYEIHYPDRTDTLSAVKKFYNYPKVNSNRGSNIIYCVENPDESRFEQTLIETSAPLNIIKVKEQ